MELKDLHKGQLVFHKLDSRPIIVLRINDEGPNYDNTFSGRYITINDDFKIDKFLAWEVEIDEETSSLICTCDVNMQRRENFWDCPVHGRKSRVY